MSDALPKLTKNMVKAMRALYKARGAPDDDAKWVDRYLKDELGTKISMKAYFQLEAFLEIVSNGNFHTADDVRRLWREFWLSNTVSYRVTLEVEGTIEVPRCLVELGQIRLVMDGIDVDIDAHLMPSDLCKIGFTTQEAKRVRSGVTGYMEECHVESYDEEG